MTQLSLSFQAANKAIELVKSGKDNHYQECLSHALRFIQTADEFTSEDIIKSYNGPMPKEPRVLGAVIKELQKRNLITKSGYSVIQSPQAHGRPCTKCRKKEIR